MSKNCEIGSLLDKNLDGQLFPALFKADHKSCNILLKYKSDEYTKPNFKITFTYENNNFYNIINFYDEKTDELVYVKKLSIINQSEKKILKYLQILQFIFKKIQDDKNKSEVFYKLNKKKIKLIKKYSISIINEWCHCKSIYESIKILESRNKKENKYIRKRI